jgi:hypothetical protein
MQEQTDKKNHDDKIDKHVKRKHVGDETANPLPEDDYSSKQPPGDDSQANPEADSSLE